MQSSRIRSNNTTTQSFTNAELEFAFYCSPLKCRWFFGRVFSFPLVEEFV